MPVLPSYGNQSIDLHSKCFLYEGNSALNGLILDYYFITKDINRIVITDFKIKIIIILFIIRVNP